MRAQPETGEVAHYPHAQPSRSVLFLFVAPCAMLDWLYSINRNHKRKE